MSQLRGSQLKTTPSPRTSEDNDVDKPISTTISTSSSTARAIPLPGINNAKGASFLKPGSPSTTTITSSSTKRAPPPIPPRAASSPSMSTDTSDHAGHVSDNTSNANFNSSLNTPPRIVPSPPTQPKPAPPPPKEKTQTSPASTLRTAATTEPPKESPVITAADSKILASINPRPTVLRPPLKTKLSSDSFVDSSVTLRGPAAASTNKPQRPNRIGVITTRNKMDSEDNIVIPSSTLDSTKSTEELPHATEPSSQTVVEHQQLVSESHETQQEMHTPPEQAAPITTESPKEEMVKDPAPISLPIPPSPRTAPPPPFTDSPVSSSPRPSPLQSSVELRTSNDSLKEPGVPPSPRPSPLQGSVDLRISNESSVNVALPSPRVPKYDDKRATKVVYTPRPSVTVKAPKSSTQVEHEQNVNIMYSEREIENLKDIFNLFAIHQPGIMKELFKFGVPEEELCETLVTMSFITTTAMQILRHYIELDFAENSKDQTNILKDTSLAAKLIRTYLARAGPNYLVDRLGDVITQIVVNERKVSLEINPSFVDPDELEKNKKALCKKVALVSKEMVHSSYPKQILDRLTSKEGIDRMPTGIRVIAGNIAEFGKRYFPGFESLLVANFIFGKYINPAIFFPEGANLVSKGKSQSSEARRNLTLITRILQYLAFNAEFGKKEEYMKGILEFMESKKPQVQTYLRSVIIPPSTTVPVPNELNVVTMQDLHNIHLIFQQRDTLLPLIKAPNIVQEYSKLLDKLGTYQNKVSFSFLSPTERKIVKSLLEERNEEALLTTWVEKRKRNKVQKRLLVVSLNRVISLKPGGKVAREGHLLDLIEIKSPDPKEIELVFKSFAITATTEMCDEIISCIRRGYLHNFANVPEEVRFKITMPASRDLVEVPPAEITPCNGFVNTYRSLCDYYHTAVHEDLAWDINNLFEPEDIRNVDISKFAEEYEQSIVQTDLPPLFHALRYNTYFTTLTIKNFKLEKQAVTSLSELLRVNGTITNLTLSGVVAPKETYISLFESLSSNSKCSISYLDLSSTQIEDPKAFAALAVFLKRRRLMHLNLASTSFTYKSVATLLSSLQFGFLSISQNKIGTENTPAIAQYLMTDASSSLCDIYLSGTAINLKSILEAMVLGKAQFNVVDLSNNKITKDDYAALAEYLQKAPTVKSLNLSSISLSADMLEKILTSFHNDISCSLNLSGNSIGLNGAKMLGKIAYKLNNIVELDLTDTDLGDEAISELVIGLKNNYYIKRLSLNSNFKGGKSKARTTAVKNLIKLISSDCSIEALSIAARPGNALKQDIIPFIFALGENTSLTELDISGHQMGNTGAIALAKSLQTNASLTKLMWDENQTGLIGFRNIKYALTINKTLKYMPLPIADIGEVLKQSSNAEEQRKLQTTLAKIQKAIMNNQSNQ